MDNGSDRVVVAAGMVRYLTDGDRGGSTPSLEGHWIDDPVAGACSAVHSRPDLGMVGAATKLSISQRVSWSSWALVIALLVLAAVIAWGVVRIDRLTESVLDGKQSVDRAYRLARNFYSVELGGEEP